MQYPQIEITGPGDVATIIPFMLGYQPHDSLAFLALSNGRVVNAAAQPLTPGTDPRGIAERVADVLLSYAVSTVVIVGYGPDGPVREAVEQAIDVFTSAGIIVGDAMRAFDDHVWQVGYSENFKNEGFPYDPRSSVVAVAATVAGMQVAADRESLMARLDPVTGPEHDRMRAAFEALPPTSDERVETLITEAITAAENDTRLPDDRAAQLLILLSSPNLRDRAADLIHGTHTQIRAWTDLVRRAGAGPLAATPAIFLALSAMLLGDGTTASMATDRALQADPDDEFVQLISDLLQAGLSPQTLRRMLNEQ